ncbi:relaxase/mobilization nuclease domain-containing protein [Staphylococcus hominis]|uniref:relaxase/mobilization nuclease domain-containing protein n=1 Tax=Staphylococcus hominis TaxID=1290 RepID=UPI0030162E07
MATTIVHSTKHLRGLISYVRDEEVHHENEMTNGERVMESDGIYATPNDAYFQMREVQRLYGKDKNEVQALHTIMSFDDEQFNYKDPTAPKRALEVARLSSEMSHPNFQSVMYAQLDGEGKKVHVHKVTNMTDLDGRVMNGKERSFYHASEYTDKAMIELGYTPQAEEKRQKGYTAEKKVGRGVRFQSNRVIEETMKQLKADGINATGEELEFMAIEQALNEKTLPKQEYVQLAVDFTIEDENVKDLDDFKYYLKQNYDVTYQTAEERRRKTGAYNLDYIDQNQPAMKRVMREKKVGTDYTEDILKERISSKHYQKVGEDYEQDRQIQELENIAKQREIEQLRQQQQQLQRHAEEQRTERANERSNSVNKTTKPNVRTNTRHTKGFELGD